jgi:hypothetical protein
MPVRSSLNVSLTPELQQFVQSRGELLDADAVFEEIRKLTVGRRKRLPHKPG